MDTQHAKYPWYHFNGTKFPAKELMWDNVKYSPSTPNNMLSGTVVRIASEQYPIHVDAGGGFSSVVNASNVLMTDGHVTIRELK